MDWYPLKLTTHVRTYAFGGTSIRERLGKAGLPDGDVAETWEVSDHPSAPATVTHGRLEGQPFHDVVLSYPDDLVGTGWRGPYFPLLAKFLDGTRALPVHLHADDATARADYGEPNGKTEAWHILWAGVGASILVGVKPGVGPLELEEAIRRADFDAILERRQIRTGETVYVPPGVLHSFGPETLVFEIQQTSDIATMVTRTDLYGLPVPEDEWERRLSRALYELRAAVRPAPSRGLAKEDGANTRIVGCAGPYFALERWDLTSAHREVVRPDRGMVLANVGPTVEITFERGAEMLGSGDSCVIPAALPWFAIEPDHTASLIACYVPDLELDIVEPLRAAGHSDSLIAALGEVTMDRPVAPPADGARRVNSSRAPRRQ